MQGNTCDQYITRHGQYSLWRRASRRITRSATIVSSLSQYSIKARGSALRGSALRARR